MHCVVCWGGGGGHEVACTAWLYVQCGKHEVVRVRQPSGPLVLDSDAHFECLVNSFTSAVLDGLPTSPVSVNRPVTCRKSNADNRCTDSGRRGARAQVTKTQSDPN